MKGWCIMPKAGRPWCSSAISVPQTGKPPMNALVPSIGSSTQTYSASARSSPNSSPTIPCWGKFVEISRRIAASAARSASVTGSNSRAGLLVLDAERRAEEGQDGLAGNRGELFDEGREIDHRHGGFLQACRCRLSPVALRPSPYKKGAAAATADSRVAAKSACGQAAASAPSMRPPQSRSGSAS